MDVGQVEFSVIADGLDTVLGKVNELQNTLNGMDGKKYGLGSSVTRAAKDMGSIQRQLEHNFVNFGSRMQTLGRTLQNLTAPFNNIMRGFTMGIGYRALNKVMDGFSNAFSRADILNTTEAVLKLQGFDLSSKFSVGTQKAATAMENLDNAVQGLPTGLDEIVASMKVYVGASEDVEKSTKMAIAANNAYIASGVDSTRKRYSERQLQNLMSGAELTTQQWDSLRKNIPLAINATAHELHMSMGDMIDDLKNGRLETGKFIDAFIKVGTEGKIYKSAQKLKITWDALSSNISIAFSRMGANLLDTLNDVSKKATGRTFLQHLLGVDKNGKDMGDGIKGIINGISESAQEWIKAHPEKITQFLDDLKNFDWKGMIGEIGNFATTMADFYGGLIKLVGGKNIAKIMLWGNVIGKALTAFGGLVRGFAGPASKILTGTFIGKFLNFIKGFGQAGKAASQAALSWQGVASKGVTVLAIPAIAWSLFEAAKALEVLDGVNMSFDLVGKVSLIGTVLTTLVMAAGSIGAALASNPAGWMVLAGTGISAVSFASIAGSILLMANAMDKLSTAQIPNAQKITEVIAAIDQIGYAFRSKNPLEAVGTMLDAWTKGAEFKAITKLTDAFKAIKKLSKIKMDSDSLMKAKENFANLKIFINDMESMFDESDEMQAGQAGVTSGALWRGNTNKMSNYQQRISSFMDMVESVANGIGSMQSLLKGARSLQKYYSKLQSTHGRNEFDWGVIGRQMSSIADGMYQLIGGGENYEGSAIYKLKQVGEQVKGMGMQSVLDTMTIIPKIINKLRAIGETDVGNIKIDNLDTLGEKIGTFVTKISGAFSGAGVTTGGVSGMAMSAGSFLAGVDAVSKAINKLNSIPTAKDMSATVESVKTAVSQLNSIGTQIITISITIQGGVTDMVSPAITAAADSISSAMKSIKNQKKTISVTINLGASTDNVTPYINRVASNIRNAIARIPSSVNKTVSVNINKGITNDPLHLLNPHTGGMVGKHRLLYKKLGGFVPRGTDTVPAMLTPGEYVMRRTASQAIGYDVLQRLNHLDLAGAVRSLSARMANGARNVTNNTRNATVNINNYNTPGVGLGRATRWVNSL